jgi:hypothetical protein
MSVIAITLGAFLVIPPFVAIWGTGKRMQLTERAAGVQGGSGLLCFVLHIIPVVSLFAPTYLQFELKKAWATRPEAGVGSSRDGERISSGPVASASRSRPRSRRPQVDLRLTCLDRFVGIPGEPWSARISGSESLDVTP